MDTAHLSGNESVFELTTKRKASKRLVLTTEALLRFIDRYRTNELSATGLQELGDLLEGDPIDYDDESGHRVLAQVVFEISTPEANGPIDHNAAARWTQMLRDQR